MSRLASIYVWLFVGAVFIAINVWILNGFESKALFAEENNPSQVADVLKEALDLSQKLREKSQKFDVKPMKLARDPFILPPLRGISKDTRYSLEKKFFKTPSVALQLPNIDGILTIRKLDGTEIKYVLVRGKVVKLGESVDGFKIVKVTSDSIVMRSREKEFRVALSKADFGYVERGIAVRKEAKEGGALAMR